MKYVFGPVPSRRLGQSLGIDTIPLKTCNWNCVYCQLGRTRPLTNERKPYFPKEDILLEVQQALDAHAQGTIDWITFVGSGEPILHSEIGWLIRQVKALTDLPVAVITNGSLLFLPEVRADLSPADAVLPSVDAGTANLYRKINRPHAAVPFRKYINGLIDFREEYRGKLWVEVMLVRGLNDSPEALWKLATVLQEIRPDTVHLNLPTRPPAEKWVQPPYRESLIQAMAILGNVTLVLHPAHGQFDLSGHANLTDAILSIITRHPMREDELLETLKRWPANQIEETLESLKISGRSQVIERYGVRFWVAAPAFFPNEVGGRAKHPQEAGEEPKYGCSEP